MRRSRCSHLGAQMRHIKINRSWLIYNEMVPDAFLAVVKKVVMEGSYINTQVILWDGTLDDPLCDTGDELLDETIQHLFESEAVH